MPVVIVLWLILFLCQNKSIVKNSSEGRITIEQSGDVEFKGKKQQIKHTYFIFKPMMLMLATTKNEHLYIWKDSCEDADYRQLLLILRKLT